MKRKLSLVGGFVVLLVVSYFVFANSNLINNPESDLNTDSQTRSDIDSLAEVIEAEPKMLYGMVVDSLEIFEGLIRRNENLSEILSKFNVSFADIDQIARKSKDIFDVRKLAANKRYTILYKEDSFKTARAFVYEPNPVEYVVFNLQDSINIYKEARAIDTVQKSISGIIEYSLYESLMSQNASPRLVVDLAEVYAWQIDFFRIQKGDRFKVIYEETQVDGVPVGLGKIIAAYFEHFDNPYFAFHFDQGSGIDYFDEEGKSLRKEFLKAPLKYSRISSGYSHSRLHPVLKVRRAHLGIDYAAPKGTPVRSIGDGIVTKKGYNGGAGHMIKVKHNSVYTTGYLHLSKYASGLKVGKKVKQGEVIGYVGSTGLSTGPHLDFRFWKNGSPVNPMSVKPPPSEPISNAYKMNFTTQMKDLKVKLDQMRYPQPEQMIVKGE